MSDVQFATATLCNGDYEFSVRDCVPIDTLTTDLEPNFARCVHLAVQGLGLNMKEFAEQVAFASGPNADRIYVPIDVSLKSRRLDQAWKRWCDHASRKTIELLNQDLEQIQQMIDESKCDSEIALFLNHIQNTGQFPLPKNLAVEAENEVETSVAAAD